MAPPHTIRIGILVCGTFRGAVAQSHGGYYDVYNKYLKNTMPSSCNANLVVEGFNVHQMEFPDEKQLDRFDLFMVTGGEESAYNDAIPWIRKLVAFLKNLIENHPRVRLTGNCFGHEVVCRALGGDCLPTGQTELGPSVVNLSDMGRSIFGVDQLCLQEIHSDVASLETLFKQLVSGDLYLVGSSNIAENQGIIKFYPSSGNTVRTPRDIHVLTLQGHPEFNESIITGMTRQLVGQLETSTVIDYWGHKGGFYDSEPFDKDCTGRRWWKTDGVDIVSPVYWKMLGVTPSVEATEYVGKEAATRVSHKPETLGALVKVEREGQTVVSGWWRLSRSFKFVSKLLRKFIGVAIRR